MNIVIFAAGFGSRLGKKLPKCLVSVDGQKILSRQLEVLNSAVPQGEIHIVSGYRHDLVKAFLRDVKSRLPIQLHRNPFFPCSGILGSAWIARQFVSSPEVLRIDGDVLFTEQEIQTLLAEPESALLVTDCRSGKHTAVAEIDPENRTLKQISLLPEYSGRFEWICMEHYRNDEYRRLVDLAMDQLPLTGYYFEAMNLFYQSGAVSAKMVAVRGNSVFEIDTPADLARTEQELRQQSESTR